MPSRRGFILMSFAQLLHSQGGQPEMFGEAESYERFMGRWSRLVAPRFLTFSNLPERGRMLDVGCGTGALAFTIAEKKPEASVVGIDTSKEYVAYAISKNRFATRATFAVGDAQQLRYPDATFDAALSLLVFNFIPDSKKALLELRRVVSPGGPIAAAVWDYSDNMKMLRAFWEAAVYADFEADKNDEKHMPLCRQGELSALWKDGGLENIREQSIDIRMSFKSFADYWDPFLLGQGPAGLYTKGLTPQKVQTLRNEVKRRLDVSNENASFTLPARVWAVRGTVPNAR